ncbi:hypothetical protein AVEN_101448-1 [Araneus ventricosus]|uniref:Uncharacterized protein n=1 Tax=Araneus ventricosus TaxID=182803 RepID=A0A4Y2CYG8_ARAVE|nr:hypothetical protein AVEN_101448-1 [Araneus ventricosus]
MCNYVGSLLVKEQKLNYYSEHSFWKFRGGNTFVLKKKCVISPDELIAYSKNFVDSVTGVLFGERKYKEEFVKNLSSSIAGERKMAEQAAEKDGIELAKKEKLFREDEQFKRVTEDERVEKERLFELGKIKNSA